MSSSASGPSRGRRPWRGRGGGRWRGWRGRRGRGYSCPKRPEREFSPAAAPSSQQLSTPHPPRPSGQTSHVGQSTIHSTTYPAWKKYLPNEAPSEQTPLAHRVTAFVDYFKSHLHAYNLDEIEATNSAPVDYASLIADEVLLGSVPSLRDLIQNQPEMTLNCMALALHTVLSSVLQSESQREREIEGEGEREGEEECSGLLPSHLPRLHIRLFNYNPITLLKNVKAPLYGKLVCVQGTVVRAGNIRPLVIRIAFQCLSCHGIQVLSLPDGKYTVPVSCLEPECRGKQFSPLRTSPQTLTVDWQTIRVQELAGDRQREAGRIPRTIEIELTSDLVDSCVPGDMVTVTAVVKATGTNEGHGRQSKDKCMFLLYLDAVSVTNNKEPDITHMQFSTKDYCGIREIHEDNNVFRLLVNSLCPNIYGHEMVKAGLVLGLFGGTQKYADCQNNIPIRGDPHVLIVGDPGLGKSQMLQSAATLAPRGVYVCGSTTSTAGLTVALSKEAGGGDFALEAGVLVLSDRGCCCIDEFDKMGSQHHALLEAMEQQSVSLAKAGLVCSLPARASILAAANPTGGHYNKAKTVSENLKMSSALLSRFDLVFILLDKPDEETDSILSEHVMALHSGANSGRRQKDSVAGLSGRETPLSVLQLDDGDERTLVEDLKLTRGSGFDPIPAPLFRKYIGYARNYIHPRLSEDAAKILQKFYKELRRSRHCVDSSPVTTRQLESLIRLTEARARLELREEATEQDARNVVEIMKFSMYDTFTDEFGMVDFKRSKNGSGMSQHSQAKRLVCALTRAANQTSNAIFTVQQIKDIARDIGIRVETVSDLIFTLNNESYILKKGPRTYQLQTAD